MSDVQVSNARRIGFTALALVSFLIVVHLTYVSTCSSWQALVSDLEKNRQTPSHEWGNGATLIGLVRDSVETWRGLMWEVELWWAIPCLAMLPTLWLGASEHNSPLRAVRDVRLFVAGAFIICTVTCAALLGDHNGMPWSTWKELPSPLDPFVTIDAAREALHISQLWLLLPIILTTAFVIIGAWRRAVRDAEVDAVGEGE